MAIQREHIYQKHLRLWCREALAIDHEFLGFDRKQKTSQWSHLHDKNIGMKKGTADTLLKPSGLMGIWCECKSPGNKPTDAQYDFGERMQVLGDFWFWATSVEEYRQHMMRLNIPMHANAEFLALHH